MNRADYLPTASLETLQLRGDLLSKLRGFFASRNFWEVETPILSADVVVDRHLEPMATVLAGDARRPNEGRRLWLQTSPEFGMKRLLAAGATAIYQVTRAFRNGEIGRLHNPEFTMVEWYRVGDDMLAGMAILSELCNVLLGRGPAEPLSYADAFAQHVDLNPHVASVGELARAAQHLKINLPQSLVDDRDAWLNLLLTECVEPQLGIQRPTILYDYPVSQAALSIVRESTPPVAERFELYVNGVELANGYHELLDATELKRRNTSNNAARVREGKPSLPEESQLLAAMEAGLPACCGVALGFDRIVMLAAKLQTVAEAMAFAVDRA